MHARLRAFTGLADRAVEPIFRHIRRALVVVLGLTAVDAMTPAAAWEQAHSVGSNTGYADVTTAAATKAPVTVPNLGTFAPGAGPVVAADGTVYLGNQQGKLIALHADGSPAWRRDITPGHAITASPLVAPNGWIYAIGTMSFTDHRVTPPAKVTKSVLNVFTPGGGWYGQFPLPEHNGPGAAYGPLNLWRSGGSDVLMVTATYPNRVTGGYEIRLIAFAPTGQVVGDQKVTTVVQTVSGGADCLIPPFCFGFEHGVLHLEAPPPGVGLFTYQGGGTPAIVVSDGIKDLVGYTFDGASFTERWRVHSDNYFLRSTPTVLPDGHTIIGVEKITRKNGQEYGSGSGAIMFAGPNMSTLPRVDGTGRVFTAPSVARDGRAMLVSGDGYLTVLQGAQVAAKLPISNLSVASAAVSRTHVFVSTRDAFLSYDVNDLTEVGRINWVGGGTSSPAIGPDGHVYALASNILFVFPPAKGKAIDPGKVRVPPTSVVTVDPGQPTTQPASQLYHPPMTTNGNRLFACLELDQDDCGKGDYKDVSLAWCQKQGYSKAKDYDVDSEKVKAETLDGRFCSKNKCKVFEEISCANN
jgi:outer membrane protein assembly factor BamB